ncbi:hypothetical protein WJX84_002274 [Apatococcus fuscideae]|uniref:DNA polymerase kappa n=1 Tax=Apatococcus fuscideae TaxID=2026836 RepID=A0AAW1TFP6_9CHLO
MTDPRDRYNVRLETDEDAQRRSAGSVHHGGSFKKYMEGKNRKLREQFATEARSGADEVGDKSSRTLLRGISIHVNGFTKPSHQELRHLMGLHGGRFEVYYYRDRVTHIICSNLPAAKVKIFERERNPTPVVRPEWITDSIAAKRILPTEAYVLWQLRDAPGQPTLKAFQASARHGAHQHVDRLDGKDPSHRMEPDVSEAMGRDGSTRDTEGPGNEGADDAGMARARRLAAAARAACDVLRGPVRCSRDGPEFMDTYYRSSRLHFIGRWKARIEALQASMGSAAPAAMQPSVPGTLESVLLQGRVKGAQQAGPKERTIIHLDMDCFFAAVAASSDPAFKGKPLAVCHSNSAKGTGEVSSANYEARAFGIKADMFIADAKRRCPDLIVMPYEFDRYETVSEAVYRILLATTACVQPISCDEAWLDVTGLGDPLKIAADVRAAIWQATGCAASAGIGPNMLLARLATRKAKPNGQFYIKGSDMEPHLVLMPVSDLPGVGWSLSHRLTDMGISTVADLRERSSAALQRDLGAKTGQTLWNFAHGRDDRVVEPPKQRRSVGAECNWGIRFRDQSEAEEFLTGLAGELCTRLTSAGVQGRTITLKLKRRKENAPEPPKFMGHGICDNMSRSVTVARFTSSQEDVANEGRQMLRALHVDPTQIRGIGLNMTKLNTDPTSASAKPGTGAPSRAAAPPPTLFGPRTMDNHPWGRIIQREMDGTFDPALGKEAMAIAEPAPQDNSDHGLQAEPDHFWLEAPELRDLAGTAAIPSTPSPSGRVAAQDPGPPSLTGEGISTSSHGVNEHMSLQVRHASPRDNHLPCAPVASGMGPQNISRGAAAEALPTYVAQQMDQAKGVQECPPVSDALPKGCTLEDLPNRARSPTLAQRSAIPHSHAFQGRRMQHGPASKADALQQPDLPAAARVMRPTEALPPVSQLDASVLDALPLAMKRELEHAYGLGGGNGQPSKRRKGAPVKAAQYGAATKKQGLLLQRSGSGFFQRPRAEHQLPDITIQDGAAEQPAGLLQGSATDTCLLAVPEGAGDPEHALETGLPGQAHSLLGRKAVACSGREKQVEVWTAIKGAITRLRQQQVLFLLRSMHLPASWMPLSHDNAQV